MQLTLKLSNALHVSILPDTFKWSTPDVGGSIPLARDGHSACVIGEKIYVFGGYEERVRCS